MQKGRRTTSKLGIGSHITTNISISLKDTDETKVPVKNGHKRRYPVKLPANCSTATAGTTSWNENTNRTCLNFSVFFLDLITRKSFCALSEIVFFTYN